MFYQDFNEQFEGYTQPSSAPKAQQPRCFIRISMNNLKDIHNLVVVEVLEYIVVLSGFQWTIWRIYTTAACCASRSCCCFIRISMNNLKDIHNLRPPTPMIRTVVLSGFQWTIWRIYTTPADVTCLIAGCFIRISMNNLKDIHNDSVKVRLV